MERYRIRPDAAVYFLTYLVVEWLPVFDMESAAKAIIDSLNFCHREKQLRINAYVIMPTHLHLIAFDADFDSTRLLRTLADFRKYTGRQLCDWCVLHGPKGYLKTLREEATADRDRRFWQPSRHPEAIYQESFWRQKFDYLHANPCRKGLVQRADHWRFSSARWYFSDGQEPVDVELSPIVW